VAAKKHERGNHRKKNYVKIDKKTHNYSYTNSYPDTFQLHGILEINIIDVSKRWQR
jgi:hypothetical protein